MAKIEVTKLQELSKMGSLEAVSVQLFDNFLVIWIQASHDFCVRQEYDKTCFERPPWPFDLIKWLCLETLATRCSVLILERFGLSWVEING